MKTFIYTLVLLGIAGYSHGSGIANLKNEYLTALPQQVKKERAHPTYKRESLEALDEKFRNFPTPIKSAPKGIEHFSKDATVYAYNGEGIRDYTWGCAWRAIQTCLSAYGINETFENLFNLFGPAPNLKSIYQAKYPGKSVDFTEFAPYNTEDGWAEPYVGYLALYFFGIPSDLETVNEMPGNCTTPPEIFQNAPIKFAAFKQRLINHFSGPKPAPIMIGDGVRAYNIIGIKNEGSNINLWIADPHIREGANQTIGEKSPAGLYKVTLDKNGKQIACSLYDEDQHELVYMANEITYKGLDFENKPWIALFPQKT